MTINAKFMPKVVFSMKIAHLLLHPSIIAGTIIAIRTDIVVETQWNLYAIICNRSGISTPASVIANSHVYSSWGLGGVAAHSPNNNWTFHRTTAPRAMKNRRDSTTNVLRLCCD